MNCKKCGVDGNFTWDQQHFENSGKWRLFDLNMERPHDCHEMKVEEASSGNNNAKTTCKMSTM